MNDADDTATSSIGCAPTFGVSTVASAVFADATGTRSGF